MKRPQIPAALSFDGCGINNASAEYCPRILTIPQALRGDPQTKTLGKAAAALPALLEALEGLLYRASSLDQSATHDGLQNCDAIANARAALRLAGYEF